MDAILNEIEQIFATDSNGVNPSPSAGTNDK